MGQAAKIKEADLKVRRRFETLLGWSDDDLNALELRTGQDWLNDHYGPASERNTVRARVEGSAVFWTWWKNQWRLLDTQLSPRLKVQQAGEEYHLCYSAPALHLDLRFVDRATLGNWYWLQHAKRASELRPDDAALREILHK